MRYTPLEMKSRKRLALVAHDNKKPDLLEWTKVHKTILEQHELYATGTTGRLLEKELGIQVTPLMSGPLGGDQQIGAMIAECKLDGLFFFWDPLESQPHDPDVKALLRIAAVWNIPVACNRSTADFLMTSALMNDAYERQVPDYNAYQQGRS